MALTVALLAGAGCSRGTDTEGVIDRETFIATYVDLRTTTLRAPDRRLEDADRQQILTRHGVTEDDLLAFAEAHAGDADYMIQVWSEVNTRMFPPLQTTPPDSTG